MPGSRDLRGLQLRVPPSWLATSTPSRGELTASDIERVSQALSEEVRQGMTNLGVEDAPARSGESVTQNRTLSEYTGINRPRGRNLGSVFEHPFSVGVELELEGFNEEPEAPSGHWNVITDGSLRNNGYEFVHRGAASGVYLENSLTSLYNALDSVEYEVTERCSTHVHLDVTDLTFQQFQNFMACCVVFEPVLFELFGDNRKGNPFCASIEESTLQYGLISELLTQDSWSMFSRYKYCGISLNRTQNLGTVEFRMFKAFTEKQDLENVIHFLFRMKQFCLQELETPDHLIQRKQVHSIREFFVEFFGEQFFQPGVEQALERGIQCLNDVLMGVKVQKIISTEQQRLQEQQIELERRSREVQQGLSF